MVRDASADQAQELHEHGCELRRADLTDPGSLEPALAGIDVVYYLAHLMGADAEDLVTAEEDAARSLAVAARRSGVKRVIYLGGLGDPSASEHLRARHRTGEILGAEGPPLTYFRAAMVVGGDSDSYLLLKSVVERLGAMFSPEWLENRTQPIGVDAVVDYLADAPFADDKGRVIEIGGPDVMSYSDMIEGMAEALGERVPWRLPTPRGVAATAVGKTAAAVTRGDPAVAENITAGLATDTVVQDPTGMGLFDVQPEPYRLVLARAIEEEIRANEAEKAAG
jgi:uncharacterized protein YbjT (DUF2867 family)